jgi:hypothetical protein
VSHEYTYNGVETTTLTYPVVFQNTNTTATATGALMLSTVGAGGTAQVPVLINENPAAGSFIQAVNGGTVTNGVWSGGTNEFTVAANGNLLANGTGTFNGTTLTIGTSTGVFTSANGAATYKCTGTNCSTNVNAVGTGSVVITSGGATANAFIIKGAASQSGDLQDWENNTPTVLSSISSAGIFNKYNGTATVNNGVPSEVAKLALTAQSAAITTTNLIASLPQTGTYKLHVVLKVTTAATTSSILGGTTGVVIGYTDGGDSVVQSFTMVCGSQAGAIISVASGNTGNTTTTVSSCDLYFFGKTATAVTYAVGYTSAGVTPMQYEVNATLLAD